MLAIAQAKPCCQYFLPKAHITQATVNANIAVILKAVKKSGVKDFTLYLL